MNEVQEYTARRRGDIVNINHLLRILSGDSARKLAGTDIDRMIADTQHHWIICRGENGRIVAMGSIFIREKPSRIFAEIDSVVVHPDHERKGLGRAVALLLLSRTQISKCSYINLTSSRLNAVRFWEDLGFVPRDTTVMRKTL